MKRFEGIKQLQSHQQSAPHQEAIAFFAYDCKVVKPRPQKKKTEKLVQPKIASMFGKFKQNPKNLEVFHVMGFLACQGGYV